MGAVIRILAGLLLVAHGLVHLIFLASDISEFTLESSWVLPEGIARTVGLALLASAISVFTLAGLAVWGVPGLTSIWPALTVIGAATSLFCCSHSGTSRWFTASRSTWR